MKIVIDSNRVIAALIKDSTTRNLLFNKKFEFIAPSYIFSEINNYKFYILKKAHITEAYFDILIKILFENIFIIPESEYGKLIKTTKGEVSDIKDIPYISVAIIKKAKGIWTHDSHFKEQNKIKVFTNIGLLDILRKDN
ncbi:hypothetical protein J4422_03780 [Candidatus Pacearchaeota archaeon]|nr:hypothetical protein [Candidatus Pacearchaeota archaeon]